MRIIAFGDIHMNLTTMADIPAVKTAELLLLTGDLTNFGGRAEAETIISTIRATNPDILALPGNLDRPEVSRYLQEEGISLHGNGFLRGNIGIFGVGGSNRTPFNTPNEFSENELAALLDQGFAKVAAAPSHLMVCHAPPLGTAADRLHGNSHVGSRAIRSFIEEKQPDLCVTGHIHEARSIDHIGRTMIINPGMISQGGWVEIAFDGNTLTAQLKTTT